MGAETTEEATVEPDEMREALIGTFGETLGEGLVDSHIRPNDDTWLRVTPEAWVAANRAGHAMGFNYFNFLCGIDWLPSPFGRYENSVTDEPMTSMPVSDPSDIEWGYTGGSSRFQVMTRLFHTVDHHGINIKVDVPADSMSVDTIIPVFAGAAWHERETWEMYGVGFAGHAGLRGIYLPSEFEGHPLRKDFPLVARIIKPWPGIVDVETMPGEGVDEGASS